MTSTTEQFARDIRVEALRMVHRAKASHIGGALSMADILAVLYGPQGRLQVDPSRPDWSERDRFILSKGHACTALYAALALAGFFPQQRLEEYAQDGSHFMAHASHLVPGVELSTGSLGHGLPVACGLAYGARLRHETWRSIVLLSDGELDEGSNWEAFLFAAHHNMDHLRVIIDANNIQSLGSVEDVIRLEPLADKLSAFGWAVETCDGHDHTSLSSLLNLDKPLVPGKPSAIIARTIKGKGVSYMENELAWHYRSPNDEQLSQALTELGVV